MKKLFFVPVIVVPLMAAYFISAQSVQAWGPQDCPTPETHPDCLQFFPSPTPVASPIASPTPDTKGDGPTGMNPDRINHPTASRGEGIGGGP